MSTFMCCSSGMNSFIWTRGIRDIDEDLLVVLIRRTYFIKTLHKAAKISSYSLRQLIFMRREFQYLYLVTIKIYLWIRKFLDNNWTKAHSYVDIHSLSYFWCVRILIYLTEPAFTSTLEHHKHFIYLSFSIVFKLVLFKLVVMVWVVHLITESYQFRC